MNLLKTIIMKKLFLIISILTISFGLNAQTIVSGDITGVWNLEGSPYWVNGNIYIVDSLIIQPGVIVQFEAGGLKIEASENDKFIAKGTESNPIIFEPKVGSNPGSWYGIYLNKSSDDDTISFCKIRFAEKGIHINRTSATIQNCTIYGCSLYGIYCRESGISQCVECKIFNNDIK